jgi:hypothetical protein
LWGWRAPATRPTCRATPRPRWCTACTRATKGYWEISSPTVWPPPETYAGMRDLAAELLPGTRFRRHLLWRYSLVWTRPAA